MLSAPGARPSAASIGLRRSGCGHPVGPSWRPMPAIPTSRGCRAMPEGHVGGARAVGDAGRLIAEGALDVALCGGADDEREELFFTTHWGAGAIASDDGRPGLVPGEGSGLLVLEEAEHAVARGARCHGEIAGFASGGGGGCHAGEDD